MLNTKTKSFSYCFRVHNYEQYLHDVGELRAMGYTIDDKYTAELIKFNKGFNGFMLTWLHVDSDGDVCLHTHTMFAKRVPNLEYIINELPVIKTSKSV